MLISKHLQRIRSLVFLGSFSPERNPMISFVWELIQCELMLVIQMNYLRTLQQNQFEICKSSEKWRIKHSSISGFIYFEDVLLTQGKQANDLHMTISLTSRLCTVQCTQHHSNKCYGVFVTHLPLSTCFVRSISFRKTKSQTVHFAVG